ncbi:type-2 histone deacetylase 1-like [Panonychus citri]|uniref:type-2 histone deacetylase 1-like n=1 Tax=Panonychus citri TaxID=50023 RepID=UPI0023079DB4|nr:type-2 histone deacetylase 1-like [Panonychus citri]XP_053209445.1 type-2 histone deacetylase 1-like [Panonychus citri]XP_053209446.1 type-2 histone deacetylase 1-like [Panonychus citri]
MKSRLLRPLPKDLLICGQDGYGQKVHSTLLVFLSAKFSAWFEACNDNGHTITNFLIPTMDKMGIQCLHELIYDGSCKIDFNRASQVVNQISQLGLSITAESKDGQRIQLLQNEPDLVDEEEDEDEDDDVEEEVVDVDVEDRLMMNTIIPNSENASQTSEDLILQNQLRPSPSPLSIPSTEQEDEIPPLQHATYGGRHNSIPHQMMTSNCNNSSSHLPESPPPLTLTNQGMISPPPEAKLENGRVRCTYCDKSLANARNWREHILALHLGQTMPCPRCGAHFKHRSTLRGHLLRCRKLSGPNTNNLNNNNNNNNTNNNNNNNNNNLNNNNSNNKDNSNNINNGNNNNLNNNLIHNVKQANY